MKSHPALPLSFIKTPAQLLLLACLCRSVKAQTYTIPDYYYPLYNGNEWVYDSQSGGGTWTTIVRVLQTNSPVTCYSNCSPSVPYVRSLASINFIQGDFGSGGEFNVDSSWTNSLQTDSGWGWVGFDHDAGTRWRFEPGLVFTNQFAIGQTVSKTNVVYDHGVCAGQGTFSIQLVEFVDVQVPAGYFSNCMHLKFVYSVLSTTRDEDQWWDKDVGPVKWTHVGGGDFETNELRGLSYAKPPFIITTDGHFGFTNGLFGFSVSGSARQTLEIQESTNLLDWVPLQTNILAGGLLHFIDSRSTHFSRRFYRVLSP